MWQKEGGMAERCPWVGKDGIKCPGRELSFDRTTGASSGIVGRKPECGAQRWIDGCEEGTARGVPLPITSISTVNSRRREGGVGGCRREERLWTHWLENWERNLCRQAMHGCVLVKGIQISLEARGHEIKMNKESVMPASFGGTASRNHHQGVLLPRDHSEGRERTWLRFKQGEGAVTLQG